MADKNDGWALSGQDLRDPWPRDARGKPEQAARLVHQSELDGMADLTISLLESFGIPAFKDGTQGKVVLGFAGLGVDIYVPASRLEEAQSLLAAQDGGQPKE